MRCHAGFSMYATLMLESKGVRFSHIMEATLAASDDRLLI